MAGTFVLGLAPRVGVCLNCRHSIVEHCGSNLSCPTNCICPDPIRPVAACPAHKWRWWAQNKGATPEMRALAARDSLNA